MKEKASEILFLRTKEPEKLVLCKKSRFSSGVISPERVMYIYMLVKNTKDAIK
jgi:hypothetical protein